MHARWRIPCGLPGRGADSLKRLNKWYMSRASPFLRFYPSPVYLFFASTAFILLICPTSASADAHFRRPRRNHQPSTFQRGQIRQREAFNSLSVAGSVEDGFPGLSVCRLRRSWNLPVCSDCPGLPTVAAPDPTRRRLRFTFFSLTMANNELYEGCRKKVVEIAHLSKDAAEGPYCCADTGVVFFHESDFAYVVCRNTCSHGSTDLEVDFGGGTSVIVTPDNIKNIGPFIGASCFLAESAATFFEAVQFYEEKLLSSESVYTLTFKTYDEAPDLTPGFVSTSEDLFFYQTCRPASTLTVNGSPVFKEDGRFVGLCYGEQSGMLAASSVRSLAQNIAQSYGTDNMGVNEVLQHVYALATQ